MTGPASAYHRALAASGLVLLSAGDFFRYLLTWYGWGALVVVGLVLSIVELVRLRVDVRRLPLPLLAFLLLAALSTIWSAYPSSTAAGAVVTMICTTFAVFLGGVLGIPDLLRAISTASRWVVGGSLVFELVVALFVRRPVLPLWVAYCDPAHVKPACYWSRDLLLDGGRIQGIQGNANLLAMSALIGLVVFAVRWAAREGSRWANGVWAVLAVAAIALTRSSTITVALLAVVVVAVFLLIAHRLQGAARVGWHAAGLVVLVAGVGVAIAARGPLLHLLGKSADLTNRTHIWSLVLERAVQRPAAGWGWVSYWPNWEPFFHFVRIKGIDYYQAHDAWIDLFLQLGVLGVVVFGLLALSALVRAWMLALHAEPTARPGSASPDAASPFGAPAGAPTWPLAMALPLLLVALLVQSIAESRLLIEVGFALLAAIAIATQTQRIGGAWPLRTPAKARP